MARVHLEEPDMSGCNLLKVNLKEAHLEEVNLQKAQLAGSSVAKAHLEEVDLSGADLRGADLVKAHLEEVDLHGGNLSNANLHKAHLEEVDLSGADLSDVFSFQMANLSTANLRYANLSAAYLEGANLSGADLTDANLAMADLTNAILMEADLSETLFVAADLTNANLALADLILYDYLVNPDILDHARQTCELICLGRHGTGRMLKQEEINQRLVADAQSGKLVVRLKSGDPGVFARLAEETSFLDEHGVAWNDPELAVHWGVNEPIISPRDLNNPLFCDLPQHVRPD